MLFKAPPSNVDVPFTPKFLLINSPPGFLYFLGVFFFVILRELVAAPTFFFVTPMRSSGSRVDIAQKPNKSGQILDQRWKIFFVIFTKLIPGMIFFCIAKIWVLMVPLLFTTRIHKLMSCPASQANPQASMTLEVAITCPPFLNITVQPPTMDSVCLQTTTFHANPAPGTESCKW